LYHSDIFLAHAPPKINVKLQKVIIEIQIGTFRLNIRSGCQIINLHIGFR